tara:strand:+ start:7748 stop:8851 length:1104 start_codon:yes stop_codon:yes gene_type:complete
LFKLLFYLTILIAFSCHPLVTRFNEIEDAIYYEDLTPSSEIFSDSLKVMTWNIRFSGGRIPWFGDSCGDRVLLTENEIMTNLNNIINFINLENPDILLLQEIDISSKRSVYLDQIQYIINNTSFNFASYASMWKTDLIPMNGLGKVDVGNAILSKWPITDASRIQLSLRTDQDPVTQYFYLRRNMLKVKIDIPIDDFYVLNIHATAFATDNTKQKHIDEYYNQLNLENELGHLFVSGGDLNSIPPDAQKYDYCEFDQCEEELFHTINDIEGPHREGSYFNNFDGELSLLNPLYMKFYPAINTNVKNDNIHFTHSQWNNNSENEIYWDRKLDYLFTNIADWSETGKTHQEAFLLSDHAPISAIIYFNQ